MKKILLSILALPLFSFGQTISSVEQDVPLFLPEGWSMIGYSCFEPVNIITAFETITDRVLIVKDYNGNVYMPEFGFNGIGSLERNRGYQIKLTEAITDFQFCPFLVPLVEGCIDSLACNYNPEANMADGSCEYAELGYDCEGNIIEYVVGMQAEGGIVFYVESSSDRGLVAALEDIEGAYKWGCYGTDIGGNNFSWPSGQNDLIGRGLKNTSDIVAGCSQNPIAASEALAYDSEGYSDWYLPSKDELEEMYNTIGPGGPEGNIGGFETSYMTDPGCYYWSSTDISYSYAFTLYFCNGLNTYNSKTNQYTYRVRAIRSFGYTLGCMYETAFNYNSSANMDDGSCQYPISGCTDSLALNFYPDAVEDDGSCYYPIDCEDLTAVTIEVGGGFWHQHASWEVSGITGANGLTLACLADGCHTFNMFDDYGDGWGTNIVTISSDSGLLLSGTFDDGYEGELFFSINDELAINDDGICIYYGCLDYEACNFDIEANTDDGTCEYPEIGFNCFGNEPQYEIGELAHGGIVFYIDSTGQHGLVAAMEDFENYYTTQSFCGISVEINGADGTAIGTGFQNTLNIVAECPETTTLASEALSYESEGYSDWYLPSKYELLEMDYSIGAEGYEVWGIQNHFYRSSSEYHMSPQNKAWVVDFIYGFPHVKYKNINYPARFIRSF